MELRLHEVPVWLCAANVFGEVLCSSAIVWSVFMACYGEPVVCVWEKGSVNSGGQL